MGLVAGRPDSESLPTAAAAEVGACQALARPSRAVLPQDRTQGPALKVYSDCPTFRETVLFPIGALASMGATMSIWNDFFYRTENSRHPRRDFPS